MTNWFWIFAFSLVYSGIQFVFAQLPNEVYAHENPCSGDASRLLILGTYHMDNPGQDSYNVQADDVLSAKRQAEIKTLVDKLASFRPTKIAVELPYRNSAWPARYKQFVEGKYQLGRSEIEQVGFQLAKRFDHPTIYPVDFPMWMNGWQPGEIESPKPPKRQEASEPAQNTKPVAKPSAVPAYITKGEAILRSGTILDYYRYLNSEDYINSSHVPYMDNMLPPSDSLYIYQGADLLTNWYKRNIRIFTNLNRIIDSQNERVLLLIGSGHTKILRDFAIASPRSCLVDTTLYLK